MIVPGQPHNSSGSLATPKLKRLATPRVTQPRMPVLVSTTADPGHVIRIIADKTIAPWYATARVPVQVTGVRRFRRPIGGVPTAGLSPRGRSAHTVTRDDRGRITGSVPLYDAPADGTGLSAYTIDK